MITKEEVQHIAGLARIGVDEQEIARLTTEMSAVLDWIDQLKEADVSGVEPTAHITGLENRAREDRADGFANQRGIIDLFPDREGNYDKVRSVL